MNVLLLIALLAAQPPDFLHEREDDLLAFTFGWPAVVEEEPALRARLAREMEVEEAQARAYAVEDREARPGDAPFNGHSFTQIWSVAGSTPQLLSLAADRETYSGGAHGGFVYSVLLWDRTADRELRAAELIGDSALERITLRYCAALNADRSERRGEPVTADPGDAFSDCPALVELPLAPADKDGDGRFDTLVVLLAPYVAGPWSEGPYIVETAFEPEDLGGIPEEFRPSFEPTGTASPTGGGQPV